MPTTRLDAFTSAYIECALWLTDADGGPEASWDDLSNEALAQLTADATAFEMDNAAHIAKAVELGWAESSLGHDFWLTRNRHGAGFWDRGMNELGNELTKAAHAYGTCGLYCGDDGLLYCHD